MVRAAALQAPSAGGLALEVWAPFRQATLWAARLLQTRSAAQRIKGSAAHRRAAQRSTAQLITAQRSTRPLSAVQGGGPISSHLTIAIVIGMAVAVAMTIAIDIAMATAMATAIAMAIAIARTQEGPKKGSIGFGMVRYGTVCAVCTVCADLTVCTVCTVCTDCIVEYVQIVRYVSTYVRMYVGT